MGVQAAKKGGLSMGQPVDSPSIPFDDTVVRPNNWRPTRDRKLLKETDARQSIFFHVATDFFYDLNMKLTQKV